MPPDRLPPAAHAVPSGSRAVPSGGDGPARRAAGRAVTALTLWWACSPVLLVLGLVAGLHARGASAPAAALTWAAIGGVVLAPPAGLVTALATGHRAARRRFAVMAAVSVAAAVLVLLFNEFAAECPGGAGC